MNRTIKTIIITTLLVGSCVGGCFIYKHSQQSKPVETKKTEVSWQKDFERINQEQDKKFKEELPNEYAVNKSIKDIQTDAKIDFSIANNTIRFNVSGSDEDMIKNKESIINAVKNSNLKYGRTEIYALGMRGNSLWNYAK